MTPEEQELAFDLASAPGSSGTIEARQRILDHFHTTDGSALGLRLLKEAKVAKDADDLEAALIVGSTFGVTQRYLDDVLGLCLEDWHHSHENLVMILEQLAAPESVAILRAVTDYVPDYLDFDENRALAVRAVWALYKVGTDEARTALTQITDDTVSPIVLTAAKERLASWPRSL